MNEVSKQPIILSIAPFPLLPPVTGAQKHTFGLLHALGKLTRVICITEAHSNPAKYSFELRPLLERRIKKYIAFGNYKLLLSSTRQLKPGAILLEQPFMGLIIYLVGRKTRIPFYIHAHNVEFLRFKSLGFWWWPLMFIYEQFVFNRSGGIFFISEEDRRLALKHFTLDTNKCFVSPFGIPQKDIIRYPEETCLQVRARHQIAPNDKLFLFFGAFKYLPNIEAFELVIDEILPRLKERMTEPFTILVCGDGLNESYQQQLESLKSEKLVYVGFVPDIDEYTACADVVINPILNGGGVKTKVVEALGFNKPVVSTSTGALGIDPSVCGKKLFVVDDSDWDLFVGKMIEASTEQNLISTPFFEKYSWEGIAQSLLNHIIQG